MPRGTLIDGGGISGALDEALLVEIGALLEEIPVPLGRVELQKAPFQPLYLAVSAPSHMLAIHPATVWPFDGEHNIAGLFT